MSREQLNSLLGEAPASKKEIVLRFRTSVKLRGKVVWVLWWRGKRLATTNETLLFEKVFWSECREAFFSRFEIITKNDDGRMSQWVKSEIKGGRLK